MEPTRILPRGFVPGALVDSRLTFQNCAVLTVKAALREVVGIEGFALLLT